MALLATAAAPARAEQSCAARISGGGIFHQASHAPVSLKMPPGAHLAGPVDHLVAEVSVGGWRFRNDAAQRAIVITDGAREWRWRWDSIIALLCRQKPLTQLWQRATLVLGADDGARLVITGVHASKCAPAQGRAGAAEAPVTCARMNVTYWFIAP